MNLLQPLMSQNTRDTHSQPTTASDSDRRTQHVLPSYPFLPHLIFTFFSFRQIIVFNHLIKIVEN